MNKHTDKYSTDEHGEGRRNKPRRHYSAAAADIHRTPIQEVNHDERQRNETTTVRRSNTQRRALVDEKVVDVGTYIANKISEWKLNRGARKGLLFAFLQIITIFNSSSNSLKGRTGVGIFWGFLGMFYRDF